LNEKVKEYLQKAKESESKKRNVELLKRGLFDRKYYDTVPNEKLNIVEYCNEQNKYYELIPIDLTDEEYNEVLKVPIKPVDNVNVNKNINDESVLPNMFYILGAIVIIIGLIYGYKILKPISYLGDLKYQIVFALCLSAIISGMSLIGLGKVIQLLDRKY